MSSSDDKDYKWLVARERGDDISHVLAPERAPYEKLGELLGRHIAPPAGFRQRVLARIDAEERARDPQPFPEPAAAAEPAAPPAPEIVARPAPEATPPREIAPPRPVRPAPTPEIVARPASEATPPRPASRWKRRLGIAVGFAAAAAAVYIFLFRQPTPAPAVIALSIDLRDGPTVMRGDQASIGDTFIARAATIGPGELRVYGGSAGKLIARCHDGGADQDGCTVTSNGERREYRLELTLELPGHTSAVVCAGPKIPPTKGSLEQDVNAAAAARIPCEIEHTRVL